jgi:hypothetical protein
MFVTRYCWGVLSAAILCASGVVSQTSTRIDNADLYSPSFRNGIQLSSPGWDGDNPGHAADRYLKTYHSTSTPGATIIFFFRGESRLQRFIRAVPLKPATGSSISYYADKDPRGGLATVRIDGEPYTNVSESSGTTGFQFQQLVSQFNNLDGEDHQIVISNMGAYVDPANGVIGLDFFEYVTIIIIPMKFSDALNFARIVLNSGSNDIAPANYGPSVSVPSILGAPYLMFSPIFTEGRRMCRLKR